MTAYNFTRWLKTLNGHTLYEYIVKIWTAKAERFTWLSGPGSGIPVEQTE